MMSIKIIEKRKKNEKIKKMVLKLKTEISF